VSLVGLFLSKRFNDVFWVCKSEFDAAFRLKSIGLTLMSRKNSVNKQNEAIPSGVQHLSKKKIWVFRLIAFIIIPLFLLTTLELSLRIVGYGHKTPAIIKSNINGRQVCHYNLEFGWRFLPRLLSRDFSSFAFDPEKPPQTYRIFVMGASAAAGIPDPMYNFGRFLEIMLQDITKLNSKW